MLTDRLLGLVLCGGESRRMGQDKGLIRHENNTWAERAAKKLGGIGLTTVLSVNPAQKTLYSKLFAPEVLIQDSLSIPGPLNGLLSTHLQYPHMDLLVLACDLTEMSIPLLKLLCARYEEQAEADFYYFVLDGQKEPLAAIYRKEALNTLLQAWTLGTLTGFSLQKQLRDERSCPIAWTDPVPFLNANTMETFRSRKTS